MTQDEQAMIDLPYPVLQRRFLALERRVQEQGFKLAYLQEREAQLSKQVAELRLAEKVRAAERWERVEQPDPLSMEEA